MSSSVFFKFKSQREPARVVFDGTGISVFELKKEIIRLNRLGDGLDFDLSIYSEDNEEYDDDTTIIPRGTSIIARRLPASRPGQGKAARYVSGKAPVNARSAPRSEPTSKSVAPGSSTATAQSTPDMNASEEDRINAMFKQQTNSWEQQQAEMAHATPVYRGNYKGKPANVPDHPPPTGYVCYRCGEKGHWIQACPTNGDPNMENRPRIKRTTGIPRSFLKTVEKPVLNGDGADNTKPSKGVMVNAAGEWVIAEPDKASWEQFQAKTKASAAAQAAAESGNKELRDRGLECSIDKRMFVEPVKTPCCSKTYCNDCITNALIESDLVCPNCSTEGVLIDNLVHDDEMIANIKVYQDEKAEAKQKEKSKTPEPKKEETPAQDSKDNEKYSKSPSSKSTTTSSPKSPGSGTSKKRQAEDEAVKVEAPAMKKQRSQESQPAAATANGFNPAIFNPMTGFPGNMPFNPPMFGNFLSQQGMNGMNFSSMGMPPMPSMMGMNPAMMNPMMAPNMMGGNNWGGMGGMNFPPQQNGMFNSGMMPNIPVALGMNGHANGNMPQVQSHGGNFPNQQRTVFSDPFPKREEDNAYFRQPVNPHRHQNRQKRVRPSDYREL
ncbi:MAG: hypothetical protein M1834_003785 [Cirrosporium novae-zelandiae]|nr:MAG: hypothetical protein M1834_003785 [Cirrosporium novae-zelandiae]